MNNLYTNKFTFSNLSSSKSSVANDFTTLMAFKFSPTTLFNSSYFLNTFSKYGWALNVINASNIARGSIVAIYTNDKFLFIENAIIKANIIITGPLTNSLIIIWNAFWTFVTSVVSLVTKLDVENLSIFVNEKFCML